MGIQQSRQKNLPYSREYGFHIIQNGCVVKQYEFTFAQEQLSFKTLVSMYKSFEVPTILPILEGKQFYNENGISFGWRLKFKHLKKTLQEQINQRISQNRRYTEQQLLKAIDCILSALMGFKLKKLVHGCLNCYSIFVNYHSDRLFKPENGAQFDESEQIYTIGLPLLLNNSQLQSLIRQNKLNELYLTPLALLQIASNKPKPTASQKGDVFSLGLVILRMATLRDVIEIYDYPNYKLKDGVLERKIFQCRKFYSYKFCNMMQKMLNRSQKSRPDLQQIFNQFSTMSTYTHQDQQSFQENLSKSPSNKKVTPTKDMIESSSQKIISQYEGGSNAKNNKAKELNLTISPNFLWVQSQELLQNNNYKSKESIRAWEKFKKRMENKSQGYKNNLF